MAALTNDITRLCDEIGMMRRMRGALISQLERAARERRNVVSAMRANYAHTSAEMARTAKANRVGFVSSLKKKVFSMRKGFAADIAGARQARFAATPAGRMAKALEERRQAEAEARKRREEEEGRLSSLERLQVELEASKKREEEKRKAMAIEVWPRPAEPEAEEVVEKTKKPKKAKRR